MAAYPTRNDTTVATTVGPQPYALSPPGISRSSNSPAPITAGIASRNA